MSDKPSYEITIEKVTGSENPFQKKAEVMQFYQGESVQIITTVGQVLEGLRQGDVLIILRTSEPRPTCILCWEPCHCAEGYHHDDGCTHPPKPGATKKINKDLMVPLRREDRGIKTDAQYSGYMTGDRYVVFFEYGHPDHLGSRTFRTKKEAQAWVDQGGYKKEGP